MLSRAATARLRSSSLLLQNGRTTSFSCRDRFDYRGGNFKNNQFNQKACLSSLASHTLFDQREQHSNDSTRNPYQISQLFQQQQIRWKRNDGHAAFYKARATPRKKLKVYHRRQRELHHKKIGKHSAPGSKAAPKRNFQQNRWNDYLNYDPDEKPFKGKQVEYDFADAMVDDLIGNTASYTSTATPTPVHMGHKHKKFYNLVADQMGKHQNYKQQLLERGSEEESSNESALSVIQPEPLPSDKLISLALRAYRDRHGTKHKPIGLAKALQHLLNDLYLPIDSFGELTFTTLLTCCLTPKEGRRIFKLMEDHQHPISSYSWSILVDIHAKLEDFEACNDVMDQMTQYGVAPSVAAYTSLMAACYKVCNSGHLPHGVRSKAGNIGWERWKEMRVVGLKPDAMSYGAMIRICAARGQPEKAVGLLEEMQQFGVKPTTLCFSSALKAVAKSHNTANRYERGNSKKQRRREVTTAHHGKLSRSILILAENAEVKQDDGFVSSLMLCAAAAGDSATAKAILLASDIRRMDHLRTIGSDSHLNQLEGGDGYGNDLVMNLEDGEAQQLQMEQGQKSMSMSRGVAAPRARTGTKKRNNRVASYEEREYGNNDTRTLSALLLAFSQAAETKGLGDMWAGRDNKGYLCENSLRLITMRRTPKYIDKSVPGISDTEMQRSALVWDEEEPEQMGKRLRRAKFMGVDLDEDAGYDMETIDGNLQNMFTHDPFNTEESDKEADVSELFLGNQEGTNILGDGLNTVHYDSATGNIQTSGPDDKLTSSNVQPAAKETDDEWYFDNDLMKWQVNSPDTSIDSLAADTTTSFETDKVSTLESIPGLDEAETETETDSTKEMTVDDTEEEWYFNEELMRWETKKGFDAESLVAPKTSQLSEEQNDIDVDERVFQLFFQGLKEEIRESEGDVSVNDIDEEMAREVFNDEKMKDPDIGNKLLAADTPDFEMNQQEFDLFFQGLKDEIGEEVDEADAKMMFTMMMKGEIDENGEAISADGDSGSESDLGSDNEEEFFDLDDDMDDDVQQDLLDQYTIRERDEEDKSLALNSEMEEGSVSDLLDDMDEDNKEELLKMFQNANLEDHQSLDEKETASFDDFFHQLKEEWRSDGIDIDDIGEESNSRGILEGQSSEQVPPMHEAIPELSRLSPDTMIDEPAQTLFAEDVVASTMNSSVLPSPSFSASLAHQQEGKTSRRIKHAEFVDIPEPGAVEPVGIEAELEAVLPGLPKSRIKQLRRAFDKSLGTPSMIRLVPLLRENMPEYASDGWLKRKNSQDAQFVMKKAKNDGMIDKHMLNGMLQVETSCARLDQALEFHDVQYKKLKIRPTPYSDRLVLQMLVKNHRLSRALAFKEKVESDGRKLDILSYGSMMEHYSRRGQLGSSVLLLKECISVHGAAPPEKYLTKIRLICRQQNAEEEVGITDLIGEDPAQWIRDGEANLKREYSKKGRREVTLPGNVMLQI